MSTDISDNQICWNGTNLIGLPTTVFASIDFNQHPQSVAISGVRELHHKLFQQLFPCASQPAAADVFSDYMRRYFNLGSEKQAASEARRFNPSYIGLLRAWGLDSNAAPGAVLKGWVENRFGLTPLYHKGVLGRFPSESWVSYLEDRQNSRFYNSGIYLQLDVLYEYCQWSLQKFGQSAPGYIKLWRGTNDCERQVIDGNPKSGKCIINLNNLASFSDSIERAEEFGDWVLEADVPTAKLLFFPELLSDAVLNSEKEYLVIGGHYHVHLHRGWDYRAR